MTDKIVHLVDKILQAKAQDSSVNTSEIESKIDKLVYALYALDSSEIAIVEST